MKKITISIILILGLISLIPKLVLARETNLITNAKIRYEYKANSSKVVLTFETTEKIDLSQENTNIIIDYFVKGNDGRLYAINNKSTGTPYVKDKSWSGYLNSYDNYPNGEKKYSTRKFK